MNFMNAGDRYMDIKVYEYIIASKNGQIKKLKEDILEFTNELIETQMFEFDNTNIRYALRPVIRNNDCILLHYYQVNDIKYDNYRLDDNSRFEFLSEDELSGIKEIKHIFVFVNLKTQKLYMNHAFKKMEKVRNFLGFNSSVFAKKLDILSSINMDSITEMMKYINCLEFKTIPEDVLEGLIHNDLVTDLVREPAVKSTAFKINYKRGLKQVDSFIKKHIIKAINQQNEVVVSYIDASDTECYLNTKKMIKNIYLGTFGLATEPEELAAEQNIFSALKERTKDE